MMSWNAGVIICYVIFKNIKDFIKGGNENFSIKLRESRFSSEIFYALLIIYTIVIIGFGLIYLMLSLQGIILVEHGELKQAGVLGTLIHSFYFSGVTLLTIGYGRSEERREGNETRNQM